MLFWIVEKVFFTETGAYDIILKFLHFTLSLLLEKFW